MNNSITRFFTLDLLVQIWIGFLFWSLLLELVSLVYFLNLATLSLNLSILLLLVILSPVFLARSKIKEFSIQYRVYLIGVSILGILGYFIPIILIRTILVALSFSSLFLAVTRIWLSEDELKRDESIWGVFVGLVILLLTKWIGISQNIIWTSWYFNIVAALITLLIIYILYREEFAEEVVIDDELNKNLNNWLFPSISFAMSFFLIYWLFSSYGVIPRWVGLNPSSWGVSIIFSLGVGILLVKQPWATSGLWWFFGFVGAILLSFVSGFGGLIGGILLGLILPSFLFTSISKMERRLPGRSYGVSLLLFLVFTLGSVFTVVYDYVPVGFLFREREEVLLLISFILLNVVNFDKIFILPSFTLRKPETSKIITVVMIIIIGLPLGYAYRSINIDSQQISTNLIAMSYNIQQGYDSDGNINFEGVEQAIRDSKAMIIGLQETDTLRVSSSNRDVVEWLATKLGMYSYAGPKTRDSTFGNAILSVYPIIDAQTVILPSKGELAVLQIVKIRINGFTVNVLNAHFGETEEDRSAQSKKTIEVLSSLSGPMLLLGDFNSEPDSPQIKSIMNTGLNDSYFDYTGVHKGTTQSDHTIDFVLYTNLNLLSATILSDNTASDHFPVLAEFSMS